MDSHAFKGQRGILSTRPRCCSNQMSEILLYYRRPDPTTWVYLSSFLTIGLFFVFHRFWSIRNLDIVLLILLAPGLLMVYEGRRRQLVESEIIQSGMSQLEQRGSPGGTTESKATRPRDTLEISEDPDFLSPGSSDASTAPVVPAAGNPEVGSSALPNQSSSVLSPNGSRSADTLNTTSAIETSFFEKTKAAGESLIGLVSQAIDGVPPTDSFSQEVKTERLALVVAQLDTTRDTEDQLSVSPNANAEQRAPNELKQDSASVGDLDSDDPLLLGQARTEEVMMLGTADVALEESSEISYLRRLLEGPEDPRELQRWGFIYLFIVEALLLMRLMLDPLMVRRPLLDPNLTTGGLYFIGISLFIFMMANVVTSSPRVQVQQGPELGPGYAMMNLLPAIPTRPVSDQPGGDIPPEISELTPSQVQLAKIAKTLAILAQFSIVVGIVLIASRHFSNIRAGVGCSLLYLLLPYTAQMTGRVDHSLPAALLLWAVLCYRRPLVAGIFLGLAGGLVYYPLFLLPLWGSFYWKRGARKFAAGAAAMILMLVVALSFDSSASLSDHLYRMFGLLKPNRDPQELRGLWALGWNPIWRLPVIVGFAILATFFTIWPARKNLGTLMSSSAALMVAAQFWHGYGGGLYIAWFMPLLLLVIFRPNLQDRIAAKVVAGITPSMAFGETETEPS